MSDERDSAGSAGDGTDTAVANRPLRPTGKRSRRGAADGDEVDTTTETKAAVTNNGSDTKTAKKAGVPGKGRRNPFAFVWNYLQQVVAELRKVIWPNRKQMVSYTTVVLVFLAFMVALIAGVDYGLARLISLVFG